MARTCWGCGRQNSEDSTHCVNPACALTLTPAGPDIPVLRTRPCYLRMLALPAGITMVIILAAAHALITSTHAPSTMDNAGGRPGSPPSAAAAAGAAPDTSPTPAPVSFPLPSAPPPTRPAGPPPPTAAATPPAHVDDDGPAPGSYHMSSLDGGCFDLVYRLGQAPAMVQKACSAGPAMARLRLTALGAGRYRISAVPARAVNSGTPLCLGSAGADRAVTFDGCESSREDQVLVLVHTGGDSYQIKVGDVCVTAAGDEARTRACGNSQSQKFTFTPVH